MERIITPKFENYSSIITQKKYLKDNIQLVCLQDKQFIFNFFDSGCVKMCMFAISGKAQMRTIL